ncbi:helix-turn-helix domain-containing protein [Symbiopectobacterium sp. RP]|uniref:helix-turn-helix domain-containing protein n=1 Tax=Symbiopectobacterium sp. RP TaxID=3248553 RepID=UPI003D265057
MRQRVQLTAEDIPLIRALLASGMPVAEVARKFETSKQHIYSIRNGKNWGAVK